MDEHLEAHKAILRGLAIKYSELQHEADKAKIIRDDAALEARVAGLTFTDAARALGITDAAMGFVTKRAAKRAIAMRRSTGQDAW